ncbi:hypothetical protein FO441_08595 [Salinicoccus cyprini]|uniref:Uncharacterized protein n=1 Tax=Salinicoccus cyprini TaxID=2493691 RepID=A0A558AU24_9STAP|nr:hypothetical protein [Salinicoccus cyprini]TVT27755.1 hypothetical protein FO441_08595 [Salinicoccus cyprini]
MEIILLLVLIVLGYIGYRWLMGRRKEEIVLELDDRYKDPAKYVEAVQHTLTEEGRTVEYKGNGKFLIDGRTYTMMEHNVSMGPSVVQRTILQPEE